jgi:hypothetical protein
MPDANPGGVTAAYVNRIVDTLKTMQSNGAKQGDMTAYINATGLTIPQLTGQEPIDLGKIAAKGVGAGVAVRERVQSGPAKDQLANLKQFFPDAEPYGDGNFIYTDPKTRNPTLFNPPGLDMGDIAGHLRMGAEMVGAGLGAAAAAPFTPVMPLATALGAGGGAAMAGTVYDAARRYLPSANPPVADSRGIGGQLTAAAGDFVMNAAGQRVGENISALAGRGVNAAVRAFQKNAPARLSDFTGANVTARPGPLTGNRALQAAEHAAGATPGGATVIQNADEQTVRQIADEATRIAEQFGGGQGPTTTQAAGTVIRDAARGAVTRFQDNSDTLYNNMYRHIDPENRVGAQNILQTLYGNVRQYADPAATVQRATPVAGLTTTPLGERFAGSSLKMLEDVGGSMDANGTLPFRVLQRLRTDIGKKLADPISAVSDIERGTLKDVYAALSRDLESAADAAGPEARRTFDTANRYYRFNMERNVTVLDKVLNKQWDQQALGFALEGGKQGGQQLYALRRNMQAQEWDAVASTVLARMGQAKPGAQNAAGDAFSADTFLTNWNSLAPEAKQALFGGNRYAQIRPELDRLVRVIEYTKDAGRMRNTSGSNQGWQYAGLFTALGGMGMAAMTGNVGTAVGVGGAAAGSVVGSFAAAKLLTSPRFVAWLADTTAQAAQPGANAIAPHMARLVAISKAEPEIRDAIAEYLQAVGTSPQALPSPETAPR